MEKRGESLMIYAVKSDKCKLTTVAIDTEILSHLLVPTMAEIRLKLSERKVRQGNLLGSVAALTEGLAIERAQ